MSDHAASDPVNVNISGPTATAGGTPPPPDPTIYDPAVADTHGGVSAEELAQWYADSVTEIAGHCHELTLRPSSIDTASWLFGIRGVLVGFPDCDRNAVDALAAEYDLPLDPTPPTGLYQRRAEAVQLGGYHPVGLTIYCTDPGAQALADAAAAVAAVEPPVPAQASLPTQVDVTVAPPPPAAPVQPA